MERYLIELNVPALQVSFDIYIPSNIPLQHVLPCCKQLIQSCDKSLYRPQEDCVLIDAQRNEIVPLEATLEDLQIKHSAKLYII